ncbi:C2H2-type zinc finger protein [Aspergillus ruber CBS 135680]|uniref:C2H2-type domain-containing protein n=1 Tax=Aspergillus ruber (strain CBS 135680) TaxID=1388766 RepID=A0A017RZD8_ASPRC|nr:uncharacterized protein EURHEDRAFT_467889 [Aspergillus ruber CBS 135680]EYE90133.1 hypothetical protein EURHEDRAFT_467889 [Aspergillus ruber CBS 135680]
MFECEECGDEFWYREDLTEHLEDYNHWRECETCTRIFTTQRACNQHMNDTDHWAPRYECESCDREFMSRNSANRHMNAVGHWAPKVPCESCSAKFHTQQAADQHMKARNHFKNYCRTCDRRFINENNLRAHLNSKTHRGTNVPCPFCKTKYTSANGLAHHLETGSCPSASKLNRETIYRMIRERDPHGVITKRQIEWHGRATAVYTATDRAFNGSHWECYICHRQFRLRHHLNQHLNSPVHQQKVYHCPKRACAKEFVTLAGLFNHLESESCGMMRFENVQRHVGNVIQGRHLISF